jgi:hypothetical protein
VIGTQTAISEMVDPLNSPIGAYRICKLSIVERQFQIVSWNS